MQREKPDPTAQPSDQASAWNDTAGSFDGDEIRRPRALPSVSLSRSHCRARGRAGADVPVHRNSARSILAGRTRASAPKRKHSNSRGTVCTARARASGAQEKYQRARQRAAAVECQHHGAAGGPAGTSATGVCRLFLLVFRAGLEIGATRPAPSVSPPRTAAGQADAQGSRWPKTRGEPSPAAGGAAAVTPIRCGGCAVLAPPGSQPGPPPPFP